MNYCIREKIYLCCFYVTYNSYQQKFEKKIPQLFPFFTNKI